MTDIRTRASASETVAASAESLLGRAADEYTQRLQRGERPEIEEYAQRFPQIAAVIRQVFPALQTIHSDAGCAATGFDSAAPPNQAGGQPIVGLLGDFRIIREIGRGGMGIVYEAEQVSLNRRVALKVLPFAAVLDAKQLQRFKNEAQAAAQLHHTNIVPVHAVGCERGVHYYAMQYIEGRNLADVIRELSQLNPPLPGSDRVEPPATPDSETAATSFLKPMTGYLETEHGAARRASGASPPGAPESKVAGATPTGSSAAFGFSTTQHSNKDRAFFRAAAQLGVQAAEALEHAHELGVIHRDIKPSNLLLDLRGNLWITDFGLAQVQSDPGLTLSGDLLGTLRYMSPEQALAKRVLVDHRTDIYSLGATLYELLTLQPVFAGRDRQELLRQIAFEEPRPPRRVNPALPRELDTILLKSIAKNPAERYASAQEFADDLRRFLEDKPIQARRPTLLQRGAKWSRRHRTVVASAVVILVLAVVGLSFGTLLLWQEQARTKAGYAQATTNEAKAKLEATKAQQEAAKADAVSNFLQDMLAAVDPAEARGNREVTVREVLDKAAEQIESGGFEEQPEIEASIRATTGLTYMALGLYAEAEPHFRTALELRRRLLGDDHRDTLCSINNLGLLLKGQGRLAEAEEYYREDLERSRRVLGDDDHHTLGAINNLGALRLEQGKLDEAESYYRQALEALRRVDGNDHPDTLITINNLGFLLQQRGKLDEAEIYDREALEGLRRVRGEDHPSTIMAIRTMGYVLQGKGKLAEAEPYFREALKRSRRVLGDDHVETLASANYLGGLLMYQGKLAEAEPLIRTALEGRRRVLGDDHLSTLISTNNLGGVLQGQGRLAEAEQYYRAALEGGRRSLGDYHPDTLVWIINVSAVLRRQNKLDEAETYCREAEERCRRVLGDDHPNTLNAINKMADVLMAQRKPAEAEPYLREALERRRRVFGDDHPETLATLNNMGFLLQRQGRLGEAESFLRQALEGFRRVHGQNHPGTLTLIQNIAELMETQGKPGEAEALLIDSYRAMTNDAEVPEARKREALERIVKLYETWDEAELGKGCAEKAAEWRRRLERFDTK